MPDWFVLLTPLLILPIILLFCFIGCGLNTQGGGLANNIKLRLVYSKGFDEGVKAIKLSYTIVGYATDAKLFKYEVKDEKSGKFIATGSNIWTDIPEFLPPIQCTCVCEIELDLPVSGKNPTASLMKPYEDLTKPLRFDLARDPEVKDKFYLT